MITFYNSTKGGVDTADQICATYNVAKSTKRWPMIVFISMTNVAGINSQVIYLGNHAGMGVKRRIFQKNLFKELVAVEISRRNVKSDAGYETVRGYDVTLRHFAQHSTIQS